MKEEWSTINGYEGYYEVSNLGRVKRSERLLKSGRLTDIIFTFVINKQGYCSSIKSDVTHASEKATVYVKIR